MGQLEGQRDHGATASLTGWRERVRPTGEAQASAVRLHQHSRQRVPVRVICTRRSPAQDTRHPPAFRQARFVTAWRKPRKLGDKLRYRITTEESASSLALANDDSADAAEESVEEMFEGSDDADFF